MKERTRLRCHVHMLEYWGGVPNRIVCDNLKTGVVKHPKEGEIVPNDAYEALGEHCMTAIMPAQVRKPKQKASAEGTVKDAATRVIAQLGNVEFTDFGQVRAAVAEELGEYNAHPFQKREGSRDSAFAGAEAPSPDPCQMSATRSANGPATVRSDSTSASPTSATDIPFPTATPGGRSICVWASRPSQSTAPGSA